MLKIFLNGIIKENPIMILMIGLCPVLACSSSATDALGMGLAATFVLVCSNIMVSSVRKIVPSAIRIPIFIVIIATFVTVVDYLMKAYTPSLSQSLGVFVPLIVVNCIILGRAEAFAYKNGILPSFFDGLGMGMGFTVGIVVLGVFRELLGNGTIFGLKTFISGSPAVIFILPPGAYIGIGILIAVWRFLKKSPLVDNQAVSPCSACAMAKICHPSSDEIVAYQNKQIKNSAPSSKEFSDSISCQTTINNNTLFPDEDLNRLKKNSSSTDGNKKL